jgi:crossover junction endodeoxyribonuclease RuvC
MFGGNVRILGIDPGLTRCGVGIVDLNANRRAKFVGVHVVRTPAENELPSRLLALESELESLFATYQPDAIALERVFSQHNVRTAMGTAQASAVAMLVAARRGLDVAMYTPTEVKAAVTGYGRADKAQITAMVTRLLNLDAPPKPADAADALALALCHAWKGHGRNRIQEHLAKQVTVGVS